MPYIFISVCGLCERRMEQAIETIQDAYDIGKLLLARSWAMLSIGKEPTTPVKIMCPTCDRTPPVEGTFRISGNEDEVKLRLGKAKPE